MDHVISNFGNNCNKTEIELKVSLFEKENVELRGQLIYKLLIMKQLKTNSKITYSLLMLLLQQIRSLHQSKSMITSTTVMIIITTVITITTTAITVKTRTMATRATKITKSEILRRTIIALMKRQFTTKS